jgi:cytochrome c oxidase assembly protein subunit 11|tara:strand:- start:10729 stop:11304 length:576 start_codon:yes stop_codon:yes gene_type:complete
MENNATKTAKKLGLVAIAMFGFGYLMVPIYNVFCEYTGINGKTGQIAQSQVSVDDVDPNRLVTVEFDTNVNPALPWKFRAVQFKQEVRPGEIAEALFIVENESDKSVVGQAIPSVAPEQASLFFNKTECFCFINQVLAPGEKKEMIVRFVVDSDLPEKISTMTLSYTFFKALSENDVVSNVKHETTKKNNG